MDMRHIKRLGQEQNDLIVLTLLSNEAITLGNCLLSGHWALLLFSRTLYEHFKLLLKWFLKPI